MLKKEEKRLRRHGRVRKKLSGTVERPRLSVHRSVKNLYAQIVDDTSERTLYSFSSLDKEFVKFAGKAKKTEISKKMGDFFGKKMKEKGIVKIAFDRGGYLYHGRIKALADSLREAGIEL